MRIYKASGMDDACAAEAVRRALEEHFGGTVTVVADARTGEVHVDRSADPQVVNFFIEGAGCTVAAVGD